MKGINIIQIRKRPFKIYWSEEEDKILFSLVESEKRKSWKLISKILINKTPSQCFYRFHSKNSLIEKKNWTKDEDKFIKEFVNKYGKRWEELAKKLNFRSGKQIRDRYVNKLDENLVRSKFSSEEDEKIINLYLKYGSKWSYIAKFFKGRTADMIKSRFYSSLQKKIINNLENFHVEIVEKPNKKKKNTSEDYLESTKDHHLTIYSDDEDLNTTKNLENSKEDKNDTLTDISFEEDINKDSHTYSIITNSNTNPYYNFCNSLNKEIDSKVFFNYINKEEYFKRKEFNDNFESIECTKNDYYCNNDLISCIENYDAVNIQENIFDKLDD